MAALTKNAISVTVNDKVKRTQILHHKGYNNSLFRNYIYKYEHKIEHRIIIITH